MMRLLLVLVAFWALTACTGTSPNPDFYTLTPVTGGPPRPDLPARPELRLGVGPVVLPEILRRPQLVRRTGPHRLQYDEFDRWAGDPEAEITRLLVLRLMETLGTLQVYPHPWPQARRLDAQVRVEVLDLDMDLDRGPGGVLRLRGHWALLGPEGERELEVHPLDLGEPLAAGDSAQALVETEGRLFVRLADDIARRIAARRRLAGEDRDGAQED